jgi:hypothetical protein
MSPEPIFIREGLAIYLIGTGDPVFVMPGPHRFQRPGLRSADALIEGLTALGRSAITYDPPGSGRSTRSARQGTLETAAVILLTPSCRPLCVIALVSVIALDRSHRVPAQQDALALFSARPVEDLAQAAALPSTSVWVSAARPSR